MSRPSDTTRALRLARDIRLSIPINQLTKRVARMFDRLEKILTDIDTRDAKPTTSRTKP